MKSIALFFMLTTAGVAYGQTTSGIRVLDEAAAALGGKDKVLGVNTMILEGGANSMNIMNRRPGPELVLEEQTEWKRSVDFANRRARNQARNTPKYPTPVAPAQQDQRVDGDIAFALGGALGGNAGAPPRPVRQGGTAAKDRRAEWLLRDPIGIVRAGLAPGAKVSDARTVAGRQVVVVTTADGDTATLTVDPRTKLPVSVSTRAYHNFFGDVVNETTFSDYRDVNGVKVAMRRTSKMDRFPTTDITVTNAVLNGDVGDLAAPAELSAAPAPVPAAPRVVVEQLAPGIWLLGPAYFSVLVEFADHTELVEVPNGEAKTLANIAEARKLVPNKPLTKAVVTHHHADHAGGIRAAISEGLTLVTYELNKPYFEEVAKRPHTLSPDALAKNPKPIKIETVGAEKTVKDSTRTMQLIHMAGNPHSETTLMVYFPAEKIVVEADLWDGRFPRQPFVANMLDIMRKYNVEAERQVDIHNGLKTRAEFEKAVAAAGTN